MRLQIRWCTTHECQVIQDQATNRAWCVIGEDQDDHENCWVALAEVDSKLTGAPKNRWVF